MHLSGSGYTTGHRTADTIAQAPGQSERRFRTWTVLYKQSELSVFKLCVQPVSWGLCVFIPETAHLTQPMTPAHNCTYVGEIYMCVIWCRQRPGWVGQQDTAKDSAQGGAVESRGEGGVPVYAARCPPLALPRCFFMHYSYNLKKPLKAISDGIHAWFLPTAISKPLWTRLQQSFWCFKFIHPWKWRCSHEGRAARRKPLTFTALPRDTNCCSRSTHTFWPGPRRQDGLFLQRRSKVAGLRPYNWLWMTEPSLSDPKVQGLPETSIYLPVWWTTSSALPDSEPFYPHRRKWSMLIG